MPHEHKKKHGTMESVVQASLNTIRQYVPTITVSPCSSPFGYTEKAPDIFLPITTILSGLLSDSTLYSNILLLDGLHPCKIISSFLSKRAIATLLDHFKIPVSAMSSFISCYAPLCTSTTPLLLQFHHHIPKHFYSPIFSKCSQTIIPPNSLSERKTHTALLFDEPRV